MKLDFKKIKDRVTIPTERKVVMCCYGANCDEFLSKDFDKYEQLIGESGQLGKDFTLPESYHMTFEGICKGFDAMDRFVVPMPDRDKLKPDDWELHEVKLLPCADYFTMPVVKFVCRITNEEIQHKFMMHKASRSIIPPDFIIYMYITEPEVKNMDEKTIRKFRKLAWGIYKTYHKPSLPIRDYAKEQRVPQILARLKISL